MTARPIGHILVPIDFSPTSEAALTYAKLLARNFEASLHLLHVMDDTFMSSAFGAEAYGALPVGSGEVCHSDAGTRLCNLLSRDEVIRFHARSSVVFGATAPSITGYAAKHGIDLIVMGTHGRTEVTHAVLGSIAEHVVRTAGCPVLTVRESGAVKLLSLERERLSAPLFAHA
jgi:universal stress protein A